MQILYCEDCGTRVDESESVLVGGKVYCTQCAPKIPAPAPSSTGTKSVRRSVRQVVTPGGGKPVPTGRATPSSGVRNLSLNPPSGFYVDTGKNNLPPSHVQAAPVPGLMGWYQRNTALAIALGAGMAGVVCLILWSLLSSPPPPKEIPKPPAVVVPATTVPDVTAPSTASAPTGGIKRVGLGMMQQEDNNFGRDLAKEAFEKNIKPLIGSKGNTFDIRRKVEKFVKERSSYKKEDFYQEAQKLLESLPKGNRPPDDATGAVPGLTAIAAFKNVESVYTSEYKPDQKFPFKTINIVNEKELKKATGRDTYIALRFTGFIDIPTEGNYTFYLTSDDGSYMRIGDSVIIDNSGDHAMMERTATLPLMAGKHAFRIDYYQGKGTGGLILAWSGPKLDKQPIPESAFFSKPIP